LRRVAAEPARVDHQLAQSTLGGARRRPRWNDRDCTRCRRSSPTPRRGLWRSRSRASVSPASTHASLVPLRWPAVIERPSISGCNTFRPASFSAVVSRRRMLVDAEVGDRTVGQLDLQRGDLVGELARVSMAMIVRHHDDRPACGTDERLPFAAETPCAARDTARRECGVLGGHAVSCCRSGAGSRP